MQNFYHGSGTDEEPRWPGTLARVRLTRGYGPAPTTPTHSTCANPDSCSTANAVFGCNALFDHLVGDLPEMQRDIETERLGGLEIDEKLELSRLLHRQVTGFGTLQYLVGVNR